MDKYNVRFQAYALAFLAILSGGVATYCHVMLWGAPDSAEAFETIRSFALAFAIGIYLLAFLKYAESKGHPAWLGLLGLSMAIPPFGVLVGFMALFLPEKNGSLADALLQARRQPLQHLEPGAIQVRYSSELAETRSRPIHDPWARSNEVFAKPLAHEAKPMLSPTPALKPARRASRYRW